MISFSVFNHGSRSFLVLLLACKFYWFPLVSSRIAWFVQVSTMFPFTSQMEANESAPETTESNEERHLFSQRCYGMTLADQSPNHSCCSVRIDSPSDLFQIYPQLNNTFKVKIKNKCLQVPLIDPYLFAFDVSIVNQIYSKEVDQLDQSKLNFMKINRSLIMFGQSELYHFNLNSKFKFAIFFIGETGVVDIALHPRVFNCNWPVMKMAL